MPQRKQPRSLLDMSVDVYINIYRQVCDGWNSNLNTALRNDMRTYRVTKYGVMAETEQIRQALSNVPAMIRRIIAPKLASTIAKNLKFHFCVIAHYRDHSDLKRIGHKDLCVEMFRCVLTTVLYDYEPEIMSDPITYIWVFRTLNSVPALTRLCLTLIDMQKDTWKHVAKCLKYLTQLEVFMYKYQCTDEVVRQLGLNCPLLTDVDFDHSSGVTNECVPHLLRLTKLQYLCLDGTVVDNRRYALLLSQLPNMVEIKIRNDILQHIVPDTLCNIQHVYGHVNDMNTLIHKCPNTTKFWARYPSVNLSGVRAWDRLRTLEISDCDATEIDLNGILTGVGPKLTELTLKMVGVVNLHDITTLCPNLESLFLSRCETLPPNADTPLNPRLQHFQKLISLQIEHDTEDTVQTDYGYIGYYVSLEKIDLDGIDIFTVDFMSEVVRRGTLANLTECYIRETPEGAMTFPVLQMLIDHCSRLKLFGYTEALVRLRSVSVDNLKRQLLRDNFDLDIMR